MMVGKAVVGHRTVVVGRTVERDSHMYSGKKKAGQA